MMILRRVCLIMLLISLPAGTFGEEASVVSGTSKTPTLSPGDRATIEVVPLNALSKNDILALQVEAGESPVFTRVVAVSGDRIGVQSRSLTVNGGVIRKINFQIWKSTLKQLEYYKWVVPGDHLLVLGDNPLNGQESSSLVLVSIAQVAGKVVHIDKTVPPVSGK